MEEKDLFSEKEDKSLLAAFGWWEKKRIYYNIAVGAAGIIVLAFDQSFNPPYLIGIIIYGIVANLFYSLGFLIETGLKYYSKSEIDFSSRRNTLFWAGLIFSVLLILGLGLLFLLTIPG